MGFVIFRGFDATLLPAARGGKAPEAVGGQHVGLARNEDPTDLAMRSDRPKKPAGRAEVLSVPGVCGLVHIQEEPTSAGEVTELQRE